MDEHGKVLDKHTIRFERLLPGPIERVWEYLVDSEKRGKWLASGEMERRAGGRIELRFLHSGLSQQPDEIPEKYKEMADGCHFQSTVTDYDPPRKLGWYWGEADGGDGSEVTFELFERGENVLLVVTQRRLRDTDEMISNASGWHTHLGILVDHLNGREPQAFWRVHSHWEAEYAKRLAD